MDFAQHTRVHIIVHCSLFFVAKSFAGDRMFLFMLDMENISFPFHELFFEGKTFDYTVIYSLCSLSIRVIAETCHIHTQRNYA